MKILIILLAIFLAIVLLVSLGILIHMLFEKKEYNKGICPRCGHPFEKYAYDAQRGRGYICTHCHNVIWVSHEFIDRKENEE